MLDESSAEPIIASIADFRRYLDLISPKQFNITANPPPGGWPRSVWVWRGQGNSSWTLHSSLAADFKRQHGSWPDEHALRERETEVENAAREWQLDWTSGAGRLSWLELMAVLQHHGAPTRMIDFSFDPYVGLWFAVSDPLLDDVDGRIYAVNSTLLRLSDVLPNLFESPLADPKFDEDAYVWRPPGLDARISAQKACFVLGRTSELGGHPSINLGFQRLDYHGPMRGSYRPGPFHAIIASIAKESLRSHLNEQLNLTIKTLMPDAEGFAADWRNTHGPTTPPSKSKA